MAFTTHSYLCVITGFRHKVDENCTLLGYYAASGGNYRRFGTTCRSLLQRSSIQKESPYKSPYKPLYELDFPPFVLDTRPLKMGPTSCPEVSVSNYHYSLRNSTEERSSHSHLVPRLKKGYSDTSGHSWPVLWVNIFSLAADVQTQ